MLHAAGIITFSLSNAACAYAFGSKNEFMFSLPTSTPPPLNKQYLYYDQFDALQKLSSPSTISFFKEKTLLKSVDTTMKEHRAFGT